MTIPKAFTMLALAYLLLLLATITMTFGGNAAEIAPAAYTGQVSSLPLTV